MSQISELIGKTLLEVQKQGDDEIIFRADDGASYRMHHSQDCCESVNIEDICGELSDLVGSPILQAEEVSNREEDPPDKPKEKEYRDSFTWTFYRITTMKGQVVIRWYGESNGCYSESVDFEKLK